MCLRGVHGHAHYLSGRHTLSAAPNLRGGLQLAEPRHVSSASPWLRHTPNPRWVELARVCLVIGSAGTGTGWDEHLVIARGFFGEVNRRVWVPPTLGRVLGGRVEGEPRTRLGTR